MADFQANVGGRKEIGAKVVALSVDSKEDAERMAGRHSLTYPILYGFDAGEIRSIIGGYVNEEPRYFQPSGFILRPDRTIAMLVQSSGAVGRLVAKDAIGFIQYYQEQGL